MFALFLVIMKVHEALFMHSLGLHDEIWHLLSVTSTITITETKLQTRQRAGRAFHMGAALPTTGF